MIKIPYQGCVGCKHYLGFAKCKAYPDAIPSAILRNEIEHTKRMPEDNGIMYEISKEALAIHFNGPTKKP